MNTWKHRAYILTIGLCISVLCVAPLRADDHEDEDFPLANREETLEFLKEKLPLGLKVLETIKLTEGVEEHQNVMEDFQHQYFEYREIAEADGKEAAEMYFTRIHIELRMDVLLHEFHHEAETKEERKAIDKRVRALLQERLDHDKRAIRMEIKFLQKELKLLNDELKDIEKFGQEDIDDKVQRLLYEDDE